jgi:hypothetical protein
MSASGAFVLFDQSKRNKRRKPRSSTAMGTLLSDLKAGKRGASNTPLFVAASAEQRADNLTPIDNVKPDQQHALWLARAAYWRKKIQEADYTEGGRTVEEQRSYSWMYYRYCLAKARGLRLKHTRRV